MKCSYSNCKLGGVVEKEDAIKDGAKYYHKECHLKKETKREIEQYYYTNINPNDPIKNVRIALSNYIDKQNYNPQYVLWCIKNKSEKINNIYGLAYILSYKQNEIDFNKIKAKETKIVFEKYENDDFMKVDKIESKHKKKWEDSWLK